LNFLEARNGEGTKDILNLKQWAQELSNISQFKETLQISLIYSILKIFHMVWGKHEIGLGKTPENITITNMEPLNQSFIITLNAADFSLKTSLGLNCSTLHHISN